MSINCFFIIIVKNIHVGQLWDLRHDLDLGMAFIYLTSIALLSSNNSGNLIRTRTQKKSDAFLLDSGNWGSQGKSKYLFNDKIDIVIFHRYL